MKEGFHLKHYDIFLEPGVHKSMKLVSMDDRDIARNPEYMSQVKTSVIDFDEVKKSYLKHHHTG